MVITPTLRGLFGISFDAQTKTITVNPHLPANWDHAVVKNLRAGDASVDLVFTRTKNVLLVYLRTQATSVKLRHGGSEVSGDNGISIPVDPVDVSPLPLEPLPGDSTQQLRILNEDHRERKLAFEIEAPSGTEAELPLILREANLKLHADGAELRANTDGSVSVLTLRFPPGEGWKTITVTLSW